jgi:hypothetical protein
MLHCHFFQSSRLWTAVIALVYWIRAPFLAVECVFFSAEWANGSHSRRLDLRHKNALNIFPTHAWRSLFLYRAVCWRRCLRFSSPWALSMTFPSPVIPNPAAGPFCAERSAMLQQGRDRCQWNASSITRDFGVVWITRASHCKRAKS